MIISEETLDRLRALEALGALHRRAAHLLYLDCPFFCGEECLAARRGFLAALVRERAPLRLQVADPEGDAADLDRLGLAIDGPARLVTVDTDLAALDDASLHQGGWLLYRSRHPDLRALLGDRDPCRSLVLGELLGAGEVELAIASFWNDREWLIALG